MRGEPDACDGWAFNWDYGECSTAHPVARTNYATLYLITNFTDDPVHDFQDFIQKLNKHGKLKDRNLKVDVGPDIDDEPTRTLTLSSAPGNTKNILLKGCITVNRDLGDPNVAFFARLESTTEEGMIALRIMQTCSAHGYACIIDHDETEIDIGDGRKLVKVSGLAADNHDRDDKNELATRFAITENGTQVARCLLAYRDGSYDPSIGPTIAMIAVHKDHRGQGLLPVLWYWVSCFIQENCTLECMNTDTDPGNVMIKATQLLNSEIERKDGQPVTDKDFFYDYAGFSVREQLGLMGALMVDRRPPDEEAVLFIPLLSREALKKTEYKGSKNITWPANKGARSCDHCSKIEIGHQRCSRCQYASYCSRDCQRNDWRRHKQWCGKTRDEVHELLVEQGFRQLLPDGSYASVH